MRASRLADGCSLARRFVRAAPTQLKAPLTAADYARRRFGIALAFVREESKNHGHRMHDIDGEAQ